MTNSADLPHSRARRRLGEIAVVGASLSLLIGMFAAWSYRRGVLLWYGDAQAHLNISRSLVDSQTPGYSQLGTVWLPMLHLLCLPFVRNNWLWSTGLAGTIPVAGCFVFAGICLYLSARIVYSSRLPAVVTLICFALNPNVLYIGSIAMTEMVFLAGLMLLLLCLARFPAAGSGSWLAASIAALWAICLTRYDGWFLIPFAAVLLAYAAPKSKLPVAVVVALLASPAPLLWMAHNWYETGNALDFLNGPYSAMAIQGGKPYPGLQDWPRAAHYYGAAARLCSGWPLLILGIAGSLAALRTRAFLPLLLLALTPLFYVWSIHSSGTPIFVPQLPPHGYYNSRYGIAVVPLTAFGAGALVDSLPAQWRRYALLTPALAVLPWLLHPTTDSWICWRESQVNSIARRAWTQQAVRYLDGHYEPEAGILTEFGDLTGIYCRAEIPLRETLHEGNGPAWWAGSRRSDLFHPEVWAIAQRGDRLSGFLHHEQTSAYRVVFEIVVPDAPVVEIYQRVLP